MRRRMLICILAAVAGLGVACLLAGGMVLCDGSIKVARRPLAAISIDGARRSDVETAASDGIMLRGWLFEPEVSSGRAVILLHGIGDNRDGVAGLARMLIEDHYEVLTPDSRGHGESGGELVTYGQREAGDVHRWVDWLVAKDHPRSLFGMGESLGGAVLIESLSKERRFRAIAAECPYADFESVAEDRVARRISGPAFLARPLADGLVWSGLLYARVKYGVNLADGSPEAALAGTSTPVLLIHGLNDEKTSPEHSRRLLAANPRVTSLWLVPGAGHTGAFGTAPEEFRKRVLGWFAAHAQ